VSPRDLLPSGLQTRILYAIFTSPMRATCPIRLIILDYITLMICGEHYNLLSSSWYNFLLLPPSSYLLALPPKHCPLCPDLKHTQFSPRWGLASTTPSLISRLLKIQSTNCVASHTFTPVSADILTLTIKIEMWQNGMHTIYSFLKCQTLSYRNKHSIKFSFKTWPRSVLQLWQFLFLDV
jgi:hypothetical protein